MSLKLKGNILVMGANRGIGLELVKQLAERTGEETHVFACCREPEGTRAEGKDPKMSFFLVANSAPVEGSLLIAALLMRRFNPPCPIRSCTACTADEMLSSSVTSADVTDEESISSAVQAVQDRIGHGGLNLLINNAAINKLPSTGALFATKKKDILGSLP